MSPSFDNAVKGLHRAARASRGLAVTYCRGSGESELQASITAVPARNRVEMGDEFGMAVTSYERDWIVLATDLVLGDEQVLPERGDRILQTVDGSVQTYEVTPLAGQRHYQPCDDQSRLLRVHTRHIATAAA